MTNKTPIPTNQARLKKLATEAWNHVTNFDFHDCQESKTENEVKEFWQNKINHLSPNAIAYIYNYDRGYFEYCQGFERIGYSNEDLLKNKRPGGIRLINQIIPEQQFMYTFEIRKITDKIFNSYSDIFMEDDGYFYSSQITLKDKYKTEWHVNNIIRPLVYSLNARNVHTGDNGDVLKLYYGEIYFITKTKSVPFQSQILHKDFYYIGNRYPADMNDQKKIIMDNLSIFKEEMNKLKIQLAKSLGLTKRQLKIAFYYAQGLYWPDIIDVMCISEGTFKTDKSKIKKFVSDNFPELVGDIKRRVKENKNKEEATSPTKLIYDHPIAMTNRIMSQMGFDELMD